MNTRTLILLLAFLLLASCTGDKIKTVDEIAGIGEEIYTLQDLEKVLNQISYAGKSKEPHLRLEAAYIALQINLPERAQEILAPVDESKLDVKSDMTFRIVQAGIKLAAGMPVAAMEWLNSVDGDQINLYPQILVRWGKYRSLVYMRKGDYITSARERIFYDGLLNAEGRVANHEQILQTLTMETPDRLAEAVKGKEQEFKGWLTLAERIKINEQDPFSQLEAYLEWQGNWKDHPASRHPPKSLRILKEIVENQPKHLALMLPLKGELSLIGKAIRDGVMAAHFYALEKSGRGPKISVIDTSDTPMEIAYELAMAKGADFIIGPLDRENARQLVNQVMPSIPVLLLNKIERSASDDIFQFGLDPETEVQQVADQAALENFSHALAIVPDDQWGERHIKAFKEYWEEKGRTLVDTIHYLPTDNFEKIIGKTLGIDESEQRARQISRMLRTPVQANPRRRQDIDFVFLLAPTTDAIKLRPSLSLHYAEDIPMYSTSYIYDSTERKVNQMDLSNIRFCDIPLKLQGYNEFQKQLLQNWPATKGPLARFYAMGADAYLLQQRIRQMQTIPQLRVYGATGILSLDNDNTLDRQLTWAYFSQGQAKPMPVLMGGFDRNP